eukprot:2676778-Pyramimonas_sp.AAC.1
MLAPLPLPSPSRAILPHDDETLNSDSRLAGTSGEGTPDDGTDRTGDEGDDGIRSRCTTPHATLQ